MRIDLTMSIAATQLNPPHPEITPGFWERYGIWLLLGIVLAGLGSWLYWRTLRRRVLPETIAPVEQARARLQALRNINHQSEAAREASRVLRQYLAAVTGEFRAELTPEETRRLLDRQAPQNIPCRNELIEFFRACEQAEFTPDHRYPGKDPVADAELLLNRCEAPQAPVEPSAKAILP